LTRAVAVSTAFVAAALLLSACGGGDGGGGQVQRVETLQQCLKSKTLPTNLTPDAQLPGAEEKADVLDTELLSPSAARLYVFDSVNAAEQAQAAASGDLERRDNVVIVYAHPPTEPDRKALEDCFSGKF
jgi:hypothetical protein